MYSTKSNPATDLKSIREELKKQMLEYHSPTLEANEIDPKSFYPKVPYLNKGTQCIGLYERELTGVFCTELSTNDYSGPYSPTRELYIWKGVPAHKEEYPMDNSGQRYLVPIAELMVLEPVKKKVSQIEIDGEEIDSNINTMTIRDRCAIEWKIPVSNKKWLNELIVKTFK